MERGHPAKGIIPITACKTNAVPRILLVFLVGLVSGGCVTRPLPPPDTGQPGWRMRQGQAVWQPRPKSPEIAGEVLLLASDDQSFVIQYSKTPLTLVAAHRSQAGWQLEIPAEDRAWRGRGVPTTRLLWLFLHDALRGVPLPPPIEFHGDMDRWRLINRRTGERLEGFFDP